MNSKILLIGGSGNLGSEILKSNLFKNIYAPPKKTKYFVYSSNKRYFKN